MDAPSVVAVFALGAAVGATVMQWFYRRLLKDYKQIADGYHEVVQDAIVELSGR